MRPASPSEQASRSDSFAQRARGAALTYPRVLSVAFGLVLVAAGAVPAIAAAATPAQGWDIHTIALPTHFSAADNTKCLEGVSGSQHPACDAYQITLANAGSKPTSGAITLTDTLPAGLKARRIDLFAGSGGSNPNLGPEDCTLATVSCHFTGPRAPDQGLEMVVFLTVEPGAPEDLLNTAKVVGGGAPEASTEIHNQLSSTPPPFGPLGLANLIAGLDGALETQAGAHPYELTTRIDLNNSLRITPIGTFGPTSIEDPRDISVDLPLGFLGTALATPTCTFAQLSSHIEGGVGGCPRDTIVGHIQTDPPNDDAASGPIYNMTPEHGVAAEFGFVDLIAGSHVLYASVVPTPAGYVLRTTGPELPQIPLTDIVTKFFGDPALRNGGAEEGDPEIPFFTNPSDCSGQPLITSVHIDSWQHPGTYNLDGSPNLNDPNWVTTTSESEHVTGCNKLAGLFKPTLIATPETNRADSPTGLDVDLKVPQVQTVGTLSTPPLKKAVVTLPEGMTVNPSSANGLAGCSLAQVGISAAGEPTAAAPTCPDAAKIGSVELETPDLPGILHGQIYVARQTENPFGTLLAIYIVVNDPTTGVVIKLPGEVRADPLSGQLTTVVDQSPQFPFSELRTHFFGGQKAALRTPAVCGKYTVTSNLTPWSAPESGPPATPSSPFKITQAPGEGECPESAAAEPHKPSFSAGTLTPTAGLYSPFVLHLRREDGSQELKGLNVTLPEGLIGKLAGLQECSDAQLAAARSREHEGGGVEEQASPSCPASSEVGTVTVGAGAGLTPYYAQGKAYLAGPYKGAPLSLAIITPAVAGPYDLGAVLVRVALKVNPETAQISAVSDPLPTILDGIPLDLRSIALNMSRNQFTLNPTSCEKKSITGEALSVLGQVAPLSNPFQVGGCKALGFKPKLSLSLKGGTKRHTFPALKAVLTYPKKGAYANIAKAQVTLPHSSFLEQGHIKTVCTRPQLASQTCPAASIYGKATAITPLLDKPVSGPVYLGVGFGHELPDLVAELDGQIRVLLDGKVDTGKEDGLRNTFSVVPDAPVTKFTLEMFGGKKSLIVNSENLCSPHAKVKAVADFTAQNGKVYDTTPTVANSCKGKHKRHGKGHKHHKAHRRPLGRAALGQLLRGW
jgi:hypothetical protein